MAKKGAKKTSVSNKSKKTTAKKTTSMPKKDLKDENLQKMLIENFVSFQTVMADLSSKLNRLSTQMSDLLNLFEKSAKTFMEKDIKIGSTDKGVTEKMDKILEQNKILAQGISLLHEMSAPQEEPEEIGEEYEAQAPQPEMPQPAPRMPHSRHHNTHNQMQQQPPMPPQPQQMQQSQMQPQAPTNPNMKEEVGNTANYQKSISSKY